MKAFTLVETLIFVAILSVFFVIAAAVSISSIRDMKFNEAKIIGTRYGEEMNEWLRAEKELDGQAFFEKSSEDGTAYCFNESLSPTTVWPVAGACGADDYSLVGKYKRGVVLTTLNPGTDEEGVEVVVTISWRELTQIKKVVIETFLTLWQ